MSCAPTDVAVLGAGSWGTALAMLLARRAHRVRLWARDPVQVAAISARGENARYLPGHTLPPGIAPTADLGAALHGARLVVVVVPSHACVPLMARVAALGRPAGVVWAAKGFEPDSGRLLHAAAAGIFGPETMLGVLSGPTFAREVAANLPAAVTLASADESRARTLAEAFHGPRFRVYTTDDMPGVEVGGAVKNVLAIAAGVADGLGFGANSRAALVTRGLAELMRLGAALGGRPETFMGLAGLGDLVLTCTDDQSRNRRFGLALGRGEDADGAERAVGQVVEGRRAAALADALARRLGVDMPITAQVVRVLDATVRPEEAVAALLAREPRKEFD